MGLILERKLVLSSMTGEIVIMDAGKSKRGDMTLFISRFLSLLISNPNYNQERWFRTWASEKPFFPIWRHVIDRKIRRTKQQINVRYDHE